MDKCADEQKFLINFIERYQCLEALWNTKLDAYSNRDEKRKQYEILLELFKEQYPNGTVEDVKKNKYFTHKFPTGEVAIGGVQQKWSRC